MRPLSPAVAWRLLREDDGPTTTEYAVLFALILVVVVTSIAAVGGKVSASFDECATANW